MTTYKRGQWQNKNGALAVGFFLLLTVWGREIKVR